MSEEPEATAEETATLLRMATSLPSPKQYTPMDKYRDFRTLFGTEQGQRVLREILAMGHLFKTSFDRDTGLMAFREGERNLAQRILHTITHEPQERPARANAKRTKESR